MTRLLDELKVRARLRLNAHKAAGGASELRGAADGAADGANDAAVADVQSERPSPKLRDCLNQVSREAGFAHWEQARRVLGGLAVPGEDMGSFWHAPSCHTLLNAWYATYDDARAGLQASMQARPGAVLLPYRQQFVVVDAPYLRALGLDPLDPDWDAAKHDLVKCYGSSTWLALAWRRLKAPAETFSTVAYLKK